MSRKTRYLFEMLGVTVERCAQEENRGRVTFHLRCGTTALVLLPNLPTNFHHRVISDGRSDNESMSNLLHYSTLQQAIIHLVLVPPCVLRLMHCVITAAGKDRLSEV